ncbi:hypothetical protein [Absidia glauca]|uniref:Uncharacterized protein n=1 Tax=Absidia glauca TaxID=4829 RepID=A0A168RMS6_ABSGL|nr:hypothetical protein [Absidia glauca]
MILRSHIKNNRLVIHEDEVQIKTTLPRRNKSENQDSHQEKVTVPVEQSVIKATSDGKKRDHGKRLDQWSVCGLPSPVGQPARDIDNDKQASCMQWTLKSEQAMPKPNDLLLDSMPLEEAIRIPALYDFYDWDYSDFVEEDPLPSTDLSDKEITEHSISIGK